VIKNGKPEITIFGIIGLILVIFAFLFDLISIILVISLPTAKTTTERVKEFESIPASKKRRNTRITNPHITVVTPASTKRRITKKITTEDIV
jgi:hypothetical protein